MELPDRKFDLPGVDDEAAYEVDEASAIKAGRKEISETGT